MIVESFVLKKDDESYVAIPTEIIEDYSTARIVFSEERLRILRLLAEKPMYPKELARRLRVNEQKVYYHIGELKKAGIIFVAKRKEVKGATAKYYSTKAKAVSFILNGEGVHVTPPQTLNLTEKAVRFLSPFIEGGKLSALIVVGSPDIHGPYRAQARDNHYAVELAMFLGCISNRIEGSNVKLDTEVREDDLKRNMIVVGGPITNMITNKLNEKLPIKFDVAEQNRIFSTVTGRFYYEDECGIVAKITNPFNPEAEILVLAGKRFQGTKAAVLAVTRYLDELTKNNALNPSVSARVVAGYDLDGDGVVDSVEFLE
nr:ArsR family transcriptional regulator [Candidatus Bathyarchaeota archaeon]